MSNSKSRVEAAFRSGKISETALKNITDWLEKPKYLEYKAELEQLIEKEDWKTLEIDFFRVLSLGDGQMVGGCGIGSNRINKVTIGEPAQGLANYLLKLGEDRKEKGIVIAFDTRLTSEEFSRFVASVFAANGFRVFLFNSFRSTGELSFTVRHLKAAAGIVLTASYNPPSDNGFKVYWEDGCQILPPYSDELLQECMIVEEIKAADFDKSVGEGQIRIIGDEIDEVYIDTVLKESLIQSRGAKIVFSPLHGASSTSIFPVLKKAGFSDLYVVKEQFDADGNFPNVKNNIPNPEAVEANDLAMEYARELNADVGLTSDADAGRFGVVAKDASGKYVLLNGNQAAVLLENFVLSELKEQGKLSGKHFVLRTMVTTDMMDAIASDFGVKIYNDLPVGFKYIGEMVGLLEGKEEFVFAGEESFGCMKGTYARDKDAAVIALMVAECASVLKERGTDFVSELNRLYREHGVYWEKLVSVFFAGADGEKKINAIMDGLRSKSPETIAGRKVLGVVDRLFSKEVDLAFGKEKSVGGRLDNAIVFNLSRDRHTRVTVRPSGAQAKIKIYAQVLVPVSGNVSDSALDEKKREADAVARELVASFLEYFESVGAEDGIIGV